MATGSQTNLIEDDSKPRSLSFSPDGEILAVNDGEGRLSLWSVIEGNLLQELHDPNNSPGILFSPDGTLFVTSGGEERITFWGISE